MKKIFRILTVFSLVTVIACNEAKRGNDSDAAYDRDDSKEQADEANDEKFADNKMENDADFVSDAVASSYGEIKFAQLATQRSSNPEVKQIANKLITDHTKSLSELKAFAQSKSISIPNEEDAEVKRKTERFADEAGKDFDKRWCKEMIDRHEESVNKFEKRAEKTENAELKALINKTLPTLRSHHDQLEACHDKLKDNNNL